MSIPQEHPQMKSQSSTPVLENSTFAPASPGSESDLPYATHQKEEFLALKSQLEVLFQEIKTLNQVS